MAGEAEERSEAASRDAPGPTTLQVRSRRFGAFEVPSDRVLHFPDGLIGFPAGRRYVLLEHRPGSPFKWLLCIDDPELGFAVADPYDLVAAYRAPTETMAALMQREVAELGIFVIVTIPPDPAKMTVNLMAPVVVHLPTRVARQIVLEDPCFPPDHLVVTKRAPATP